MPLEERTERVSFRMHMNDKKLLLKLLADMNLSVQDFGVACMDAFLRGDPHIIKAIQDWKLLNDIPKDQLDRYTLSHRERQELVRQLEEEQKGK